MHYLVLTVLEHLAVGAPSPTPSTTSPGNAPVTPPDQTTVKVAIIGAVGLVLSVSIPALVATFNRSRSAVPTTTEKSDYEKELLRRAKAAEATVALRDQEIAQRARGTELRDREIERLERLLWSRGIDPATQPPASPASTATGE